eukprot:7075071-Alexandrium_andersonii.AAC.1
MPRGPGRGGGAPSRAPLAPLCPPPPACARRRSGPAGRADLRLRADGARLPRLAGLEPPTTWWRLGPPG